MKNGHLPECCCTDCIPVDQVGSATSDVNVGDTIWFKLTVDGVTRQCKASVVGIVDDDHIKVLQPGYNTSKTIHAGDIVR
jgi:hypothetical protein